MAKRNGTGIALLADETRRRIVALLAVRPRRPSGIATELGLSRPATSRQLRLLEQAGLIWAFRSRLDGRAFVYSINPSAHGRIIAWLAGTDVGLQDRINWAEVVPLDWNDRDSTPVDAADSPSPNAGRRRSA